MSRDIIVDENVLLEHPLRIDKVYETVSFEISTAFTECRELGNRIAERKIDCQRKLMEIRMEMNNRTPASEASTDAHNRLERFQELAKKYKILENRLMILQQCEKRFEELQDQGRMINIELNQLSEKMSKLTSAYNSIIERFLSLLNRGH